MVLGSCAVAFAQTSAGPVATGPGAMAGADYLLSMGPYGALVWGAYLLGRGVKVTVQIELSERDRHMIERAAAGSPP